MDAALRADHDADVPLLRREPVQPLRLARPRLQRVELCLGPRALPEPSPGWWQKQWQTSLIDILFSNPPPK